MATTLEELVTVWRVKTRDEALNKMKVSIESIKSSMIRLGVIAAGAGASLGAVAWKAGQHEQIKVTLDVLTGSATAGKKLLDELTAFADVTPFETKDIIEYGVRLKGVGFESNRITKIVKNLGDAAAGLGADKFPRFISALATMRSVGKVDFEFLRRFLEAGLPLLEEMADHTGKTQGEMKKLISAGKVSVEDVLSSIERLTTGTGRFAGLMEKQSMTFLGLVSTIKGKLDNLIKEAGISFLPIWKKLMKGFIEWFNLNREIIKLKMEEAFKVMADVVGFTVNVFRIALKLVNLLAQAFGGWRNFIWLTVFAITGGLLLAMATLTVATYKFVAGLSLVNAKLILTNILSGGLLLVLGLLIAAVLLIAEDFYVWAKGGDAEFGKVYEWLLKIYNGFSSVGDIIRGVIRWFDQLIERFSNSAVGRFFDKVKGLGERLGIFGGLNVDEGDAADRLPALPFDPGGKFTNAAPRETRNFVEINANGASPEAAKELVSSAFQQEIHDIFDNEARLANNEVTTPYRN